MSDEQPSPPLLKWQPLIDKAKIRLTPDGKAVSVIIDIKENCKTEPANAFLTELNKAVTHQLNFSGSGEANPKIKNIKFALVNPKVARQRHAAMPLATFSQAERVLHLVEKAGIEAHEISRELRAYGKKALDPWYHSHNALTRLFTRPKDPKNPPLSTSRTNLSGEDEDRGPALRRFSKVAPKGEEKVSGTGRSSFQDQSSTQRANRVFYSTLIELRPLFFRPRR